MQNIHARSGRARLRCARFFGVVAILSGAAAAVAAPAEASTLQFTNSFEGNPWSNWEGFTGGDGVAGADINQGLARSGANNGWLYAGHGWAAERIGVTVGSWQSRSNCTASIYAQPTGGGAQTGLSIWDPNGWRELTVPTVRWVSGPGYQQISAGPVNLTGLDTVYVQAIYGNDSATAQFVRLDDVSLRCVS
jgi:hypothetical protein